MNQAWKLYIIRCRNNTLYTGITMDVERRFLEHSEQGAKCAKYLRGKAPLDLVYVECYENKRAAMQAEISVKSLSKRQKESLIINGRKAKLLS